MIAETLTGRHLVLTGVTGFLGKVWLAMLLERVPEVGQVTLLVRGGRDGAQARFAEIADTSPVFRRLKQRYGARFGSFLAERLQVVQADLNRPDCGLDATSRAELSGADLIVHCAGITDFDPDPKMALATNTEGAVRIAELAKQTGAKLLHVSTCYVAGCADGEVAESVSVGISPNGTRFDPREELAASLKAVHRPRRGDRVDAGRSRAKALGWPNIYTWSKGLAEHVLCEIEDLDLTIVRPSIVECAATFPFPGWNEGVNTAGPLAWLISTAFRRLPANPQHRFDIVPVDYVARGLLIASAAALRGEAPPVLQLASSDVHPLTFGRTIELTGLGLRRYTRKGGGTELEKRWFRHLDPVPGKGGWVLPVDLRTWIPGMLDGVDGLLERDLPARLKAWLESGRRKVRTAQTDVERIEGMLEIFQPFIHDMDWCFDTSGIRALSAALPPEEADLAFDVTCLDWCTYWVDVEFPGLMKWSIPILRGDTVPVDMASDPPLQLVRTERVASK